MAHLHSPRRRVDATQVLAHFAQLSLDNLAHFLSRTTEHLAETDWLHSQQRVVQHVIADAKRTVDQLQECAAKGDNLGLSQTALSAALRQLREALHLTTREATAHHWPESLSGVCEEALDLLAKQLEASHALGRSLLIWDAERQVPPTTEEAPFKRRPGVVTRVEIEAERGVVATTRPLSGVATEAVSPS
ncbi:MAG: hypothetical protein VKP62_09205 [Candidatus Sericytochromatia bacterium]|nr:hypothetical protein [Candidatus Sericytochromatia bacterium]